MSDDLEQRLAAAQERVRELSHRLGRDTMDVWRAAREDQFQAERDLAADRGQQYAQVIDIGPRWDLGAPLPHPGQQRVAGVRGVPDEPARSGLGRHLCDGGFAGR